MSLLWNNGTLFTICNLVLHPKRWEEEHEGGCKWKQAVKPGMFALQGALRVKTLKSVKQLVENALDTWVFKGQKST